jgi:CheY-like chemotaxis protein
MIRILLVEDNFDNREMIKFLLERDGFEVISAGNGKEGVTKAHELQPDLVLMDLSLPEMDGWHAARLLKDDAATKHIPLIAVTAHTLPGDRKKALDAGFDNYLSKPINVNTFTHVIRKMLEEKKS